MGESGGSNRREFLRRGAAAAGVMFLAGCTGTERRGERFELTQEASGKPEEGVSPAEDLMREHGVLRRILLIYGEAIRRLDAGEAFRPQALNDAAGIVRSFVEDYHEKLEEDFLFPRFDRARKLQDLVKVLLEQHQAGRRLTDTTLRVATAAGLKSADDRRTLTQSLHQFIRMYNPHAAREDTILFPAFKEIVTADEYDALGDEFEKKENELFGDKGFEKVVERVATIEKGLGIYDLKQFTPLA